MGLNISGNISAGRDVTIQEYNNTVTNYSPAQELVKDQVTSLYPENPDKQQEILDAVASLEASLQTALTSASSIEDTPSLKESLLNSCKTLGSEAITILQQVASSVLTGIAQKYI